LISFIYRYHGEAVFAFVLGLSLALPNPANRRREKQLLNPDIIYRYHGPAALFLRSKTVGPCWFSAGLVNFTLG